MLSLSSSVARMKCSSLDLVQTQTQPPNMLPGQDPPAKVSLTGLDLLVVPQLSSMLVFVVNAAAPDQ